MNSPQYLNMCKKAHSLLHSKYLITPTQINSNVISNIIYNEKLHIVSEFKEWLNSKECLTLYNNIRFKDLQEEYMKGSLSTWEMESLGMYYHEHELAHVNKEKYSIVNFNELPEEPVIIDYNYYKKIKLF